MPVVVTYPNMLAGRRKRLRSEGSTSYNDRVEFRPCPPCSKIKRTASIRPARTVSYRTAHQEEGDICHNQPASNINVLNCGVVVFTEMELLFKFPRLAHQMQHCAGAATIIAGSGALWTSCDDDDEERVHARLGWEIAYHSRW